MIFKKLKIFMLFCLASNNVFSMHHAQESNLEGNANIREVIQHIKQQEFIENLEQELACASIRNGSVTQLIRLIMHLPCEPIHPEDMPAIYLEKTVLADNVKPPKQMIFSTNDQIFAYLDPETNITNIFNTQTFDPLKPIDNITEPYSIMFESESTIVINAEQVHKPTSIDSLTIIREQSPDITTYGFLGKCLAFYTLTDDKKNAGYISLSEKVSNPVKLVLILLLMEICKDKKQTRESKSILIRNLFYRVPRLTEAWDTMTSFEQSTLGACLNFDNQAVRKWYTYRSCHQPNRINSITRHKLKKRVQGVAKLQKGYNLTNPIQVKAEP